MISIEKKKHNCDIKNFNQKVINPFSMFRNEELDFIFK